MKTYKDIKQINYNDLSFFKSIKIEEAKFFIASVLEAYRPNSIEFNKSGSPRVKVTDLIKVEDAHLKINSCSNLDQKNLIEYYVNYFNNGVPIQKLREYSMNKQYIKALKFTGNHTIVNDILNRKQLRKLQETWLLKNCLFINRFSKNTVNFIIENESWSIEYLLNNNIKKEAIEKNLNKSVANVA